VCQSWGETIEPVNLIAHYGPDMLTIDVEPLLRCGRCSERQRYAGRDDRRDVRLALLDRPRACEEAAQRGDDLLGADATDGDADRAGNQEEGEA
jgi:hypothetical protein